MFNFTPPPIWLKRHKTAVLEHSQVVFAFAMLVLWGVDSIELIA